MSQQAQNSCLNSPQSIQLYHSIFSPIINEEIPNNRSESEIEIHPSNSNTIVQNENPIQQCNAQSNKPYITVSPQRVLAPPPPLYSNPTKPKLDYHLWRDTGTMQCNFTQSETMKLSSDQIFHIVRRNGICQVQISYFHPSLGPQSEVNIRAMLVRDHPEYRRIPVGPICNRHSDEEPNVQLKEHVLQADFNTHTNCQYINTDQRSSILFGSNYVAPSISANPSMTTKLKLRIQCNNSCKTHREILNLAKHSRAISLLISAETIYGEILARRTFSILCKPNLLKRQFKPSIPTLPTQTKAEAYEQMKTFGNILIHHAIQNEFSNEEIFLCLNSCLNNIVR